jgi:hypothetical protein
MDKNSFEKYLFYKKKYLKLSNQLGGNKCNKKSNIALLTTSPHIDTGASDEYCLYSPVTSTTSIVDMDVADENSDDNIKQLYKQINKHYSKIKSEMKLGKKESCWAWWVFPTNIKGRSEPEPKTSITNIKDASELFKSKKFKDIHNTINEYILNLIKTSSEDKIQGLIKEIFPNDLDHARIRGFITFWRNHIEGKPNWFDNYLDNLKKANF